MYEDWMKNTSIFGETKSSELNSLADIVKRDYIHKQKIRDKIEEYKKRKENCNDIEAEIRLDVKIRAYEELLEEE